MGSYLLMLIGTCWQLLAGVAPSVGWNRERERESEPSPLHRLEARLSVSQNGSSRCELLEKASNADRFVRRLFVHASFRVWMCGLVMIEYDQQWIVTNDD